MAAKDLTIVIPTFNENDNVEELLAKLDDCLQGIDWEAVFVDDDSPDGTAEHVFTLNQDNPNVRCLKRVGRRGLSSACIEGICSSSAPYVAVMDADMQHDETILPDMLAKLKDEDLDLVIGSRFTEGGSTGVGLPGIRLQMSLFATWLGVNLLGVKTSDPMSGFFMLKRSFFYNVVHHLSGKGFKILLDLMASSKAEVKFGEVGYQMRAREHGDSKLDSVVLWEYLLLLCEKTIGRFIPVRFIFFVAVGLLGAIVHLVILLSIFNMNENFIAAQSTAVVVAMTINYFLNNAFTYSDRRNKGSALFKGLLIFYLSCASGAAINIMVAKYLYDYSLPVAIAGLLGAGVGAVWNYSLSSQYAWKSGK